MCIPTHKKRNLRFSTASTFFVGEQELEISNSVNFLGARLDKQGSGMEWASGQNQKNLAKGISVCGT